MEKHDHSLVTTHADDERLLYFGRWQAAPQGATACRWSNTQYSACEFSFKGSVVTWLGSKKPDQGYADVYLDGAFQCTVDRYAPTPESGVLLFAKNDLSATNIHTLRLVVNKQRNDAAADCCLEIECFQSRAPVHYPTEIADLKRVEYAQIRAGTKPYLEPTTWLPVANAANAPTVGITLQPGIVRDAFQRNIAYLNRSFSLPSYCGADFPSRPEGGPGWSQWLPASNEGRLLAGAAHTLRWEERADMRTIVNTIVTAIEQRTRADGYYNYYAEQDSYAQVSGLRSERKNYDRVFWTRGLLAAGLIGDARAYPLLRRMYDWFNASPYLPDMLEGSNATNGLPGGPLMYLSPVGVASDLIVTERYYDQEYWIRALIAREPLCLSHYPGERPHCYDLLGLEAFVDEYRATGARKYLDAARGGWEIYRNSYKHIGGATAICERDGPYPPKSYYITTGHNGETCGSVFWITINGKLLQLFPEREEYAAEIEESLLNVVMAAQTRDGDIRYHNRLHGTKERVLGCGNTCCEVSAVGLLARVPELIYSVDATGFFVNLYAASSMTHTLGHGDVTLTMLTAFPVNAEVSITVATPVTASFDIRVRIPAWASGRVTIKINGADYLTGQSGSYVSINRKWSDQDVLHFTLPIGFSAVKYTGLDQVDGNLDRYALMYGPVLMALSGELTGPDEVPRIAATPTDLLARLAPVAGRPLEFTIQGYPAYRYRPYWRIDSETFTCFPIVQPL